MSTKRIVILLLGMAAILVLGTWGWTEALSAVSSNPEAHPVVVALAGYGIAFGFLMVGFGFPYLVMRFRNDDW